MKLKNGVIMNGLQLSMRPVIIEASIIWSSFHEELVITSALDGEHLPTSLHYYGYALDFRTSYFTPEIKVKVSQTLTHALQKYKNNYKVIIENDHIHVEQVLKNSDL